MPSFVEWPLIETIKNGGSCIYTVRTYVHKGMAWLRTQVSVVGRERGSGGIIITGKI